MSTTQKRLPRTGQNGGVPLPNSGESRIRWLARLGAEPCKWPCGDRPAPGTVIVGATDRSVALLNKGDEIEDVVMFRIAEADWQALMLAHNMERERCELAGETKYKVILLALLTARMRRKRRRR